MFESKIDPANHENQINAAYSICEPVVEDVDD